MNTVESVSLPKRFIESVLDLPRPIVFVINCSNAMHGAPLNSARACCRQLLGLLADDRCFNLIAYGSGALAFDVELHAAGARAKALANDFLDLVDVMGGNAIGHALDRALRHAVKGPVDIVLIAAGRAESMDPVIRQARELSVRVHCIDYSTADRSTLSKLAENTQGSYVRMPKPENTHPIPKGALPHKYVCYDTALIRLGRRPVACHPDDLVSALRNHLHSDHGNSAEAEAISRIEDVFPASLAAGLREFRLRGAGEGALVACLKRALRDILQIGDVSWTRVPPLPTHPAIDRLLYLEMRILIMSICREWCLQEVVFNESYDPQDIPAFLRR